MDYVSVHDVIAGGGTMGAGVMDVLGEHMHTISTTATSQVCARTRTQARVRRTATKVTV
jgi:hypothetical protein